MKDKILNEVEFELLKDFQKFIPSAIIAGGSVRDMHFGLPFSDVDIFYDMTSMPIAYLYDEVIPRIFGYTIEDKFWRINNSAFQRSDSVYGEDTRDIVELEKNKGSRYQFIAVTGDPVRHVHKFDLNCCKIFYDGEKIHQTGDFKDFWKTKELDISENYKKSKFMGVGRLDKRVDKILFRYKKFDVKVSPSLEGLLKEIEKKNAELPIRFSSKSFKISTSAAMATQPITGEWTNSIPTGVVNPYFSTATTPTADGNPFASPAAAVGDTSYFNGYNETPSVNSAFADALFEPITAAYDYGQGELIQLEPVPENPEQA